MMIHMLRLMTVRSMQTGLILALAFILLVSTKTDAYVTEDSAKDTAKPAAGEDNGGTVAGGLSLLASDAANPGLPIGPGESAAQGGGAGWDFTRNDAQTGGLYNIATTLIADAGAAAMPPPDALACIAAIDFYLYAVQSPHIIDTLLAFQNFAASSIAESSVPVIPAVYTPGIIEPFKASSAQTGPDPATPAAYDGWMEGNSSQSAGSAWFDAGCSV